MKEVEGEVLRSGNIMDSSELLLFLTRYLRNKDVRNYVEKVLHTLKNQRRNNGQFEKSHIEVLKANFGKKKDVAKEKQKWNF